MAWHEFCCIRYMLLRMVAPSNTDGFAQEDQMKNLMAGLATGLLTVCLAGVGSATPFSDMRNFDELVIEDSYSYTHQLTGLMSPPYILQDATLSFRHNGNSDNPGEVWFSYADAGSDFFIGQLTESSGSTWTIDTWTLSHDVLDLMDNGTPWSLTINLYDNTTGTDKLKIDYSILAGNYYFDPAEPNPAPTPEPATILLMGAGLLGFAAFRRKFKR